MFYEKILLYLHTAQNLRCIRNKVLGLTTVTELNIEMIQQQLLRNNKPLEII